MQPHSLGVRTDMPLPAPYCVARIISRNFEGRTGMV
jgi:hypothetical protein